MAAGVVIVGAGHGGFETAAALRRRGFEGRVTLVGEEPRLPYQRPPLSKAFLAGKVGHDALWFRPREFFERHDIDLKQGEEVAAIDRTERSVVLASSATIPYDHLVLATGARPRNLSVPGIDLDGVVLLRTLSDAETLAHLLHGGGPAVVIGGGFIGLEFAAVANSLGVEVFVVEALPRLMARAVTQDISDFYAREHERWGVHILLSSTVNRLVSSRARVGAVELSDGRQIPADIVVIAIGIEPEVRLAEQCGLAVQNGVIVDESLRTADSRIFAIGDCATFPSALTGGYVRLESVQNAADHAECVADQLIGHERPYTAVPWFWSDQRDLKLQMAGLATDHDRAVVRGDPAERNFSVFWFKEGMLLGGESVNRPGDHMVIRRLLGSGLGHTLSPEQAADPQFDLKLLAEPARTG